MLHRIHSVLRDSLFYFERKMYLLFVRKRWIRTIFFCLYLLFLAYFLFLRMVVPSLTFFGSLLFFPCFVIALPGATEPLLIESLNLLNNYLSLSEQDPEWINWVQRELNERTPDAELAHRIQSLITLEESSLKRNAVIEALKHFDYSSGAFPPVEPYILEGSVRSLLSR